MDIQMRVHKAYNNKEPWNHSAQQERIILVQSKIFALSKTVLKKDCIIHDYKRHCPK